MGVAAFSITHRWRPVSNYMVFEGQEVCLPGGGAQPTIDKALFQSILTTKNMRAGPTSLLSRVQ
jgi:hypothetical protein